MSAAARSNVNYVDTNAGERSEDVVQRLRVQLQRPAAARHHDVRRRHQRTDDRTGLRREAGTRTCCSTAIRPRAASRSARSSRSPARCRSGGASRSASRSRACRAIASAPAALSGGDGVARPERAAVGAAARNPNGVGTVWLITPTTTYSASSPCVAPGQVHGRPAGRSGHDRHVPVGAAGRAEDRVSATASTSST